MKNLIFMAIFLLPLSIFCQCYDLSQFDPLPVLDSSIIQKYPHVNEYYEAHKEIVIGLTLDTGIPASFKMATMMLESNYGRSTAARLDNNHTGMTYVGKHPLVKGSVKRYDKLMKNWKTFNVYDSSYECFLHHAEVLKKSRYNAILGSNDPYSWADYVAKKGYAEDKEYSQKIRKIIQCFGLFSLDYYIKKNSKLYYSYNLSNGNITCKGNKSRGNL